MNSVDFGAPPPTLPIASCHLLFCKTAASDLRKTSQTESCTLLLYGCIHVLQCRYLATTTVPIVDADGAAASLTSRMKLGPI